MQTETLIFEIVPADLGLETSAKTSLELAFNGFFERARDLKSEAEKITDPKEARALRLKIKADRVEAEKTRKRLKEDSLRMGKAIDGANNIYLALVTPIEQAMEDIEKEEERKQQAKIAALRDQRAAELDELGATYHGILLGSLTEDQWAELLQQSKDIFELRKERERKAEQERIAAEKKAAEEREAQRLENIRLKAEAEAREKELAEERRIAAEKFAAVEKERKAAEEKARKEREEIEVKAAKERAEAFEKARIEAEARARAEAEAKALRDAEIKRIADEKAADEAKAKAEQEAAKKAANAPDKAKLIAFAQIIRELKLPDVKSEQAESVRLEIESKVASFAKWIEAQASTL